MLFHASMCRPYARCCVFSFYRENNGVYTYRAYSPVAWTKQAVIFPGRKVGLQKKDKGYTEFTHSGLLPKEGE